MRLFKYIGTRKWYEVGWDIYSVYCGKPNLNIPQILSVSETMMPLMDEINYI